MTSTPLKGPTSKYHHIWYLDLTYEFGGDINIQSIAYHQGIYSHEWVYEN